MPLPDTLDENLRFSMNNCLCRVERTIIEGTRLLQPKEIIYTYMALPKLKYMRYFHVKSLYLKNQQYKNVRLGILVRLKEDGVSLFLSVFFISISLL